MVLLQPPLLLAQPVRARGRDRLRLLRALLVERALGVAQPAAPPLVGGQVCRQLVAARRAKLLVLGAVDGVRLGQYLRGDLVVVARRVPARVRVDLRAIDREHRDINQTRIGAEREHLAEQPGQRLLVTLAEARDRAVIGHLVRGDHPVADVLHAGPLNLSRRPAPARVRVNQKPDHHRRIVGRALMAIDAVGAIKRIQIHLLHRRQHEPREVVLRQPLHQRRRHQQHLLTITRQEVLGHARIVNNRPDSRPFVQQPRRNPVADSSVLLSSCNALAEVRTSGFRPSRHWSRPRGGGDRNHINTR